MILKRLAEFATRKEALPPMYQKARVKWLIDLDANGRLVGSGFVPLTGGDLRGRDRGREMVVPHVGRTVKIVAKLLADNAEYVLGTGDDPKAIERHRAFCERVERCSEETGEPCVKAVLAFLREAGDKAALLPEEAEDGDVFTFRVHGQLPVDLPSVKAFWARETMGAGTTMECLVCGQVKPVEERLPLKIKGIPGGQMSGTALISANSEAFESYGLSASLIAPTCRECGEAFANAANQMIRSDQHHLRVGPTMFLFWTREQAVFNPASLLSDPQEEDVKRLVDSYRTGARDLRTDADSFYALSLSASGGRVVVRDWLDTTVPTAQANLASWFGLQRIVDANSGAIGSYYGVWWLATSLYIREKAKEQMVANVPRALVRCALHGGPLPNWILAQAVARNRAEQGVTRNRAALTKAVLLSQLHDYEEDHMERLDETCKSPGYLCGRLLAELEAAQYQAVRPSSTLVDRFYGAASASPAIVFGSLLRNLQAHMAKLRRDRPAVYRAIDNRIQDITSELGEFPKTLNLKEQALFALGYYHEKAANRTAAIAHATAQEEEEDELR